MTAIAIIDPTTEEQIGETADGGPQAVNEAVSRARETFLSGVWHGKTPSERARILWRVADLIEQHVDELASIDSRNVGVSRAQARNVVLAGAEMIRYYSGWCTKIQGMAADLKMAGGITGESANLHAYTLKEPVGVAAAIIPWNGPVYNAIAKFAPALTAGCSLVLKPAEETPLSAVVLERLLKEAGVPDGVANFINGYGHTTGAALAAHPDVDKIAFTGSTEVGKLIVQAAAASNLKKVMLELGGKSPVLIFKDADMSRAIAGAALGIFINSGQGCVCGSRVYVQRPVYEQVVEGIARAAKALRLGGPNENADIGPLISRKQLDRVTGFLDEGRRDGVEIITGGRRLDRRGYFVEPTVLTRVRPEMRLFREEIFGPVVAVVPFDEEDEVVASANNSIYGLAAAVWTNDLSRSHRLAKRLQAGTVWLNAQFAWDPAMPFGGYKQSGWGHEYGWEGVNAYLSTKSVYTGI